MSRKTKNVTELITDKSFKQHSWLIILRISTKAH